MWPRSHFRRVPFYSKVETVWHKNVTRRVTKNGRCEAVTCDAVTIKKFYDLKFWFVTRHTRHSPFVTRAKPVVSHPCHTREAAPGKALRILWHVTFILLLIRSCNTTRAHRSTRAHIRIIQSFGTTSCHGHTRHSPKNATRQKYLYPTNRNRRRRCGREGGGGRETIRRRSKWRRIIWNGIIFY